MRVSRVLLDGPRKKRDSSKSMSQSLSLNFSRPSPDSVQSLFCSKMCERLCYVSMRVRWPEQKRDCSLSDSRPRFGGVGGGGGTTIYGLHRVCAMKGMVFSLLWERVYKSESLGLQ